MSVQQNWRKTSTDGHAGPQFLRPSLTTMAALEIERELPDQSVLAALTLDNGNVVVTVTRDSINLYDPADLQDLQTLSLPHALHPAAHPPHVSCTDMHLIVHVPVSSAGPRARTTPMVYAFDAGSRQLFPLDLDAFDLAPAADAAERNAGKRSALFRDSLSSVALARPRTAPLESTVKATTMDEDEDALYGGGGGGGDGETKAESSASVPVLVQPQDLGADRWEWIAEVDAKGDLKVRTTTAPPEETPRELTTNLRRSASCRRVSKCSALPLSRCFRM